MRAYFIVIFILLSGCAALPRDTLLLPLAASVTPSPAQLAAGVRVGISEADLVALNNKPLYQMRPEEIDRYLVYLHVAEPNLRARIAHLGRKNLGQPYEIYLLGEFPYEVIDSQPLFSLEKSDCVVFVEHTYAMALAQSWEEFFWILQRIRYRGGVIGVTSRNHYTETDWNPQNAWLVRDISATLAGERTAAYQMNVDRTKFFKSRYKIDHVVPIEQSTQSYVPKSDVAAIASQLQAGDLVNVISGQNGDYWASHVGIVVLGRNGERNLLHSSEPVVREESFDAFISRATERELRQAREGKAGKVLAGFKFLRLNESPVVPPMTPQPRPAARL